MWSYSTVPPIKTKDDKIFQVSNFILYGLIGWPSYFLSLSVANVWSQRQSHLSHSETGSHIELKYPISQAGPSSTHFQMSFKKVEQFTRLMFTGIVTRNFYM